jgi:hypothetical protein
MNNILAQDYVDLVVCVRCRSLWFKRCKIRQANLVEPPLISSQLPETWRGGSAGNKSWALVNDTGKELTLTDIQRLARKNGSRARAMKQ